MKDKLYIVTDNASLSSIGLHVGDVVEAVLENAEFAHVVPVKTLEKWKLDKLSIHPSNLAPFYAAQEDPYSPSNGLAGTLVPPEAKEDSSTHTKPSTGTSHDAHYASMAVEPVTISEMMMENEAIPAKARYHAAKAVEYFTRAGRKEGQDWKKEFEKALNHGYRAIHGKWPWETRDR